MLKDNYEPGQKRKLAVSSIHEEQQLDVLTEDEAFASAAPANELDKSELDAFGPSAFDEEQPGDAITAHEEAKNPEDEENRIIKLNDNLEQIKRRKKVKGKPKKRPAEAENIKPASVSKPSLDLKFKDYDEELQHLDSLMGKARLQSSEKKQSDFQTTMSNMLKIL